jgi:hypothetical protein
VLTQLTAFVAVDRSRVTAGGKPVRVAVPVEVPDAVAGIAAGGSYGAIGYGIGGGGTGWGTIGFGSYGTIGHGSGEGVGYGGGAGVLRATAAAVPTVSIGAPVLAAGSLDKPIIRRYIRRQLNQIQYCYEKRLMSRPSLAGTLTVHFTISGDGPVVAATANGLDDAEVEACVAGVIKAIEFPRPDGGGTVQVNYPFEFHPAKEPSP